MYLTLICVACVLSVGTGSTWRIGKASWRYLASFRLPGDPVASGVPRADSWPGSGMAPMAADAAGYDDGMCCCAAMEIWTAA